MEHEAGATAAAAVEAPGKATRRTRRTQAVEAPLEEEEAVMEEAATASVDQAAPAKASRRTRRTQAVEAAVTEEAAAPVGETRVEPAEETSAAGELAGWTLRARWVGAESSLGGR